MFKNKKTLGQNFLVNPHILDKLVSAAKITKDDIIIEIGPGTGNLTRRLAEKTKKVITIEKDRRLIPILEENLKDYNNVDIIEGDALKLNPTALLPSLTDDYCATALPPYCASYKIVANIPYYITSNFLRKIFEEWPQPKLIVLTVQKEVALRIMARPPHMNLLALSVQYYSEPEIIGYISKNNFRPVPKVDSAIIKLSVKVKTQNTKEIEKLFKLMKIGFSEKRKQFAAVLSKKLKIPKENIIEALKKEGANPDARAENLSLEQWQRLKSYLFN